MIYAVGIDTVEKVTHSNPDDLHQKINAYNKEHSIYKGHIGLNDMKLLVTIAKEIPLDIEYWSIYLFLSMSVILGQQNVKKQMFFYRK